MNDTGLPSPFIDIMMLRPALRTSHSAFCACGVGHRARPLPRQAEIAHQLDQIARAAPTGPSRATRR